MCPVAAKSKNSNPSSKKKINKKINSNLEKYQEDEKIIKSRSYSKSQQNPSDQ